MKKKKEEATLIRRKNKQDSEVKVQQKIKIAKIQISSSAGGKKVSPKNYPICK